MWASIAAALNGASIFSISGWGQGAFHFSSPDDFPTKYLAAQPCRCSYLMEIAKGPFVGKKIHWSVRYHKLISFPAHFLLLNQRPGTNDWDLGNCKKPKKYCLGRKKIPISYGVKVIYSDHEKCTYFVPLLSSLFSFKSILLQGSFNYLTHTPKSLYESIWL